MLYDVDRVYAETYAKSCPQASNPECAVTRQGGSLAGYGASPGHWIFYHLKLSVLQGFNLRGKAADILLALLEAV
ncbi:MAG: hypothetical protein DM484_27795 [Candidatus Methylumidiphilus alinenensis]|uniref:Uncharacterized protein n=1 Tax=Candidatus Methylumidiphilus alinenensis TaxID=2202197 RepID=A0A2W4QF91_9GAMM|nr:MAG: hypothetical protein DM484_27795 [Candidatus Methylumidiphilus alinenensis]